MHIPKRKVILLIFKREYLLELGIEAIINYLRKSRQDEEMEKRTGEDTLKAQSELMERVLTPIDIPYDQRSEIGSGDKIDSRPVFQSVIRDLRDRKYQAIAVKEISRMGRGSYTDMGTIYDLIVDHRIFIITPYKLYDPNNPADLRQIRFELFMSREEFETTRERLMGGRINNAMGGLWVGGAAPYGYTYNKKTRKLEINEDEAAVVRLIFDYYVNGIPTDNGDRREVSYRALSSYLTKHTLIETPRGKNDKWRPLVIQRLISNDRYIGVQRFRTTKIVNGKQIPRPEEEHIVREDVIPRIIDQDIWDRAQEKINKIASMPKVKMDFSPCELASLCICTECGRKMVRQYSVQNYKTKSGAVNTYHKEFLWCTTIGCTFAKYRVIEEDILYSLLFLSDLDESLLKEQVTHMVVKNQQPDQSILTEQQQLEQIDARKKTLQKRVKFIYEKYESGKYTDEVFDERMLEVNAEMAKLTAIEENLTITVPKSVEDMVDPTRVSGKLKSVLSAYHAAADKTEKNTILRSVIDHILVTRTVKGRGRIPSQFKLQIHFKYDLLVR